MGENKERPHELLPGSEFMMHDTQSAPLPETPDKHSGNFGKGKLFMSAALLLGLALGFNLLFNWTSLEKLYFESNHSKLGLFGLSLKKNLEKALLTTPSVRSESSAFSESLLSPAERLRAHGESEERETIVSLLDVALQNLRAALPETGSPSPNTASAAPGPDAAISIVLPDGTVLQSTDEARVGTKLSLPAPKNKDKGSSGKDITSFPPRDGRQMFALSVRDGEGRQAADIVMEFSTGGVPSGVVRRGIITFITASLLLMVLLALTAIPAHSGFSKKEQQQISFRVFLVIVTSQLVFSYLNIIEFANHAWNELMEETEITTSIVKSEIESALGRTGGFRGLVDVAAILNENTGDSPQINRISLFGKDGQLVHVASREGKGTDSGFGFVDQMIEIYESIFTTDLDYKYRQNIAQNDEAVGYIATTATPHLLGERILKAVLDTLTVMVISILFLMELMILKFEWLRNKVSQTHTQDSLRSGIMRPAAFLFVFGIDISVSFLPLHMEKLYQPLWGLPKSFVMGLPISVEFIFVGLTILLAGYWVDRRGWHEPFFTGLGLASLGLVYSWLAPDAIHLILSRAVAGAGYGLSLMASQAFMIHFSGVNCKAHGLAQLFAGIYAGSICGSATGGMLSERFSYQAVFGVGAAVLCMTLLYSCVFLRTYIRKIPSLKKALPSVRSGKNNKLLTFLLDRTVIALIFFSSLPASIAVIGFLNYFSPIYLSSIGASQSTIGRVLMLYGISLVYIGPYVSRYVDASNDKRFYVFAGCLLGSMTFLTFYFFDGIWAAVLAVLLLGLSSSFVLASQSAYVLQLQVTRELGEGKAIGIFRSSSRIGQALGPMIFGGLMASGDIHRGITLFGIIYLLTAFIFLLVNQRKSRAPQWREVGEI